MELTIEEKMMYQFMKAVYDSGIPVSFKGSMVLKVCLLEMGYQEDIRHTVDIDGNWCSDKQPSDNEIAESLQRAVDLCNLDLLVELYRNHGEKRSAGFKMINKLTGETLFTMDIDVNRTSSMTQIYEIDDIKFIGVSPLQMISDKITVISTDKIFWRIKDFVDLYYFSKTFEFNLLDINKTIKDNGKFLGNFNAFLYRKEELKHAYDKFRFVGDIQKIPFDNIYNDVKEYISDIISSE